MRHAFFFLAPLFTISLFFITQEINPLSEIVISTEQGSIRNHDYVQLNFLDGHNLKIGDGWRDVGYSDGSHIWYSGSEGRKDPFEKYKVYAPTFGYAGSTSTGVQSVAGTGSACITTGIATKNTGRDIFLTTSTDAVGVCQLSAAQWDIGSISIYSTITDTSFRYDITAVTNARNCDFSRITNNPTTTGAATLWDDIVGTISDLNYVTDNSGCTTVANDKVVDLGTTADSDVQSQLDDTWFAIGKKYNNMVRGTLAVNEGWSTAASNELQITYTTGTPPTVPDQVTGLTATAVSDSQINLSWTAPSNGGSAITGYHIIYECPTGSGFSDLIANTGTTATTASHAGLAEGTQCNYEVAAINAIGQGAYSSAASATTGSCNNAINDLHYTYVNGTAVTMAWTAPSLGHTISGYQINYTTPFGTPLTVQTNNTATTTTTKTIGSLGTNLPYSFRVHPWAVGCTPINSNIMSVTTNPNLTIGQIPTNVTDLQNPTTADCNIKRTDINSTAMFLNVTYPDTYDPAINFAYRFAMTNQTYTNFSNTTVDADHVRSDFQFNGVNNDIVQVTFWDQNTNATCKTVIWQNSFPLLQQIHDFRTGEFGTMGAIGVLDIVSMSIIILALIGMNRTNDFVGIFFAIVIVLALRYFEIITDLGTIIQMVALLLMLGIAVTRKD